MDGLVFIDETEGRNGRVDRAPEPFIDPDDWLMDRVGIHHCEGHALHFQTCNSPNCGDTTKADALAFAMRHGPRGLLIKMNGRYAE
jgi:hypothetical protein